jgi:hypothetical protein
MKSLPVPQSKGSDLPGALHLIPGQLVGHRDAQQAHCPVSIIELSEQPIEQKDHALCVSKAVGAADAAGEKLEIAPPELKRERPPCQVVVSAKSGQILRRRVSSSTIDCLRSCSPSGVTALNAVHRGRAKILTETSPAALLETFFQNCPSRGPGETPSSEDLKVPACLQGS